MHKIVLAIDSFKGCLSSQQVEEAVRRGLQVALPACQVVCVPVSDGGEGILPVLVRLSGARYDCAEVSGPLGQPVTARYAMGSDRLHTAYIELASASGLPLVAPEQRDPLRTTTLGVGQLILHALSKGCRHVILGIGGSATNDAAMGLLSALGIRFLDREGKLLPGCGASLAAVASIDRSRITPLLKGITMDVVCDVASPFFGPEGAAYVFAPQKGASPTVVKQLDEGLRSLAGVLYQTTGVDVQQLPGAGAAGGVGGALAALLGAQLLPGIDYVLDALQFDHLIAGADLVITGEGHADAQSLMGKVVSGVLKRTRAHHVPVVLLCGAYDDPEALYAADVTAIFPIVTRPMSLATSMDPHTAASGLTLTATQLGRLCAAMKQAQGV